MKSELDYYAILSVSQAVSAQDLKRQYRRLAKIYHPDRNPGEEEWCSEQMRKVNEAFSILSDPAKRAQYDRELGTDQRASTTRDPGTSPRADQARTYSTWQTTTPPPPTAAPRSTVRPPVAHRRSRVREAVIAGVASALIFGAVAMVASTYVASRTPVAAIAPARAAVSAQSARVRVAKRHIARAHRRYASAHMRHEAASTRLASEVRRPTRRHPEHRLTAAEKDARAGALAEKIEMAKRAAAKNNDL